MTMRGSSAFLFACVASGVFAGAAAATPVLYATPFGGVVIALDPVTYVTQGTAFSNPALVDAGGLALGPNGHVYVVDGTNGTILEFDRTSGALVDTVVTGLPVGVSDIAFGPNGDLYFGRTFGSFQGELRRYDPDTGALLGTLAGVGPGFAFGPDGLLYGAAPFGGSISRYDPVTLALVDVFASSALPTMTFLPGWTYFVGGVTHLAFASDGSLVAMNQGTFRGTSPFDLSGVSGVSVHGAGGTLLATSMLYQDFLGQSALAVDPANGRIISATDQLFLWEWHLGGGSPVSTIGSVGGYMPRDLLFVPEPGPLAGLALFALAAARAARRHPRADA